MTTMFVRERRSSIAAAALVALITACAPALESMRMTPVALEPRPANHPVRIYEATLPRCSFEEIAVVTAEDVGLLRHSLRSDHTAELLRVRQLFGDVRRQ